MSLSDSTPPRPGSRIRSLRRMPGPLAPGWMKACLVAWFLVLVPEAFAERYLTLSEAQKLCFPEAERFDLETVRFTPEQARAIEKKIRAKVLNRGNRVWTAWQGTNVLGLVVMDQVLGKHELIDYVVAIHPDGRVQQIEILEYRESHGYEIRGAKWRDQFKGKTAGSKLKLNDDISNLSGATISCRQVTEGVKRVLATYELVLRPRLPAAGARSDAAPGERVRDSARRQP